jgi:hypothetical protein
MELTSEHVNSGVTTLRIHQLRDKGTVVVYREEEMTKVLIHELIHYIGIDFKNIDSKDEQELNEYFKLIGRKSININESFTDTLACLINTGLYTLLGRGDYNEFIINLKKERKFILDQAQKVLINGGYMIVDDVIVATKSSRESTHVMSYYVLKAANFVEIQWFLQYLVDNDYCLDDKGTYIDLIKGNINRLTKVMKLNNRNNMDNSLKMSHLDAYSFWNKQ